MADVMLREDFKPRDHSRAELIVLDTYLRRVRLIEGAGLLPGNWRSEIEFDFTECPHTQLQLVEVEGPHGIWGMEICVTCGTQVRKECPHIRCDWLLDDKLLRCANCGVDAT